MKTLLSAMSLALAAFLPVGAYASELKPLEAGTFLLGSQSVSVYYTVEGDVFQVVTTIAPDGTSGAPMRFVGFLQPGEKALVSSGEFGTRASPATLVLVHQGDRLSATKIARVATVQ
ncbi:MAG TPA: hypothetical protein VFV80_05200 [Geminicoccaceae bacterium]|nr:hypothetical protein [Geminicoccaceae bacterium]